MAGTKTNERPGTRAVLSSYRASAYKFREVLDLIRGLDVKTAREILSGLDRDVAGVIGKLLDSAVANAVNNDSIPADELFVAACFADEGPTMKRFRARARGRAGAIRKRTAHVTIIVARLSDDRLKVVRSKRAAEDANRRARRVARTRGGSTGGSKTSSVVTESPETSVSGAPVVEENSSSVVESDAPVESGPESEAVATEAIAEESPQSEQISESVESEVVDEASASSEPETEEK